MMLSIFRESDEVDGSPGPVSARRVLSFLSFLTSAATGVLALCLNLWTEKELGWYVFLPCIGFLAASIGFLVLTTISDVQMIVAAWKGTK